MSVETCPLLDELGWVKHGFFNRHTPVENTLTDVQYFSGQFPRVFFLPQTHSDCTVTLMQPFPDSGADACYTDKDEWGVALAVKTADCCPILLACTRSKMVAAIHAGWPGALNRIAMKTVHEMILNGADPTRMIAALGPCLHQENFAVGADVYDQFKSEQPEVMDNFTVFEDRWKMDMVGILTHQLKFMGLFQIWASQHNTYSNPDYFSYRNRHNDPASATGRNVSIIAKVKEDL